MFAVLDLLTDSWPDVVVAVLAGPLAVAGLAKAVAPAKKLAWPIRTGLLGAPHGPRVAGLAGRAAALAVVWVPGRTAGVGALAAYVLLTVAAYLTRGEQCACFGV